MSEFDQTLKCLDDILNSECPEIIFSHLVDYTKKFGIDYVTTSRLAPEPLIQTKPYSVSYTHLTLPTILLV